MLPAESGIDPFSPQARTLSLLLIKSSFGLRARVLNPAMGFRAAPTSTGVHIYWRTHILRMHGKVFGLRHPIITVVQSAQSIMGKHATRGYAACSAPWCSLAQPKVRAVFVMVGNVLGEQPPQVPLVESDHMVEQLAAAAAHPTFGDTILPRTFERGPHVVY